MKPIHRIPPNRRMDARERNNYKNYKEELKEDFNHSCGYCGDTCEYYEPHIDHFRPQNPKIDDENEIQKFHEVKTSYENLVFSCPYCNRKKSNKWPTEKFDLINDGEKGFVDPCDESFREHLSRYRDGRIYSKTSVGDCMFKEMGLGVMRHQVIWLIEEIAELQGKACSADSCAQLADTFKKLHVATEVLKSILRGKA